MASSTINYIKERTKNTHFVIISLRNNMFELTNRLVGIYKANNWTESVTLNPHLINESEAAHRQPNLTGIPPSSTTNVSSTNSQSRLYPFAESNLAMETFRVFDSISSTTSRQFISSAHILIRSLT